MPIFQGLPPTPLRLHAAPAHTHNNKTISAEWATKGRVRTKISASHDRPPRGRLAVTAATAATHAVRMVVGSPTSPVAISGASGMGIPKAAAPGLPVGWQGKTGGCIACREILIVI